MAKRAVPPIATCVYNSTCSPKAINQNKERKGKNWKSRRINHKKHLQEIQQDTQVVSLMCAAHCGGSSVSSWNSQRSPPASFPIRVDVDKQTSVCQQGSPQQSPQRKNIFKTELKLFRNWLWAFSNTPCMFQTNYSLKYARFEWLEPRLEDKPGVGIRRVGDATPDWVKRGYLCCTLRNN